MKTSEALQCSLKVVELVSKCDLSVESFGEDIVVCGLDICDKRGRHTTKKTFRSFRQCIAYLEGYLDCLNRNNVKKLYEELPTSSSAPTPTDTEVMDLEPLFEGV